MLFDTEVVGFESYKKRNLYYKLFAGYLFNELVEGWQGRFEIFGSLLAEPTYPETRPLAPLPLQAGTTHVSFDNHLIQLTDSAKDHGEFADVLLFDWESRALVAIKAKFLSDWEFEKDVKSNGDRLEEARRRLGASSVTSVLLVTDTRWKNVVTQQGKEKSQYRLLVENHARYPVRVLTWEQVHDKCTAGLVRSYLDERLERAAFARWQYRPAEASWLAL
jgi:hypothetical protein